MFLPEGIVIYVGGKKFEGSIPDSLSSYVPEDIQKKIPESLKGSKPKGKKSEYESKGNS